MSQTEEKYNAAGSEKESFRRCSLNTYIHNLGYSNGKPTNRYISSYIGAAAGYKPLKIICKYCRKGFQDNLDFKAHPCCLVRKNVFTCDICQKSFTKKNNFSRHRVSHTYDKTGDTSIEPARIKKPQLNETLLDRISANCVDSGNVSGNLHSAEPNTDPISLHAEEKPFICAECCKEFPTPKKLKKHLRSHIKKKPVKCEICNREFSQKCTLMQHLRIHVGKKQYQCVICSKTLSCKQNLDNHLRRHTGEKPFACEKCPKKFSQNRLLKAHLRNHNGEKPFMCDVCQKTFTGMQALNTHLLIHNGEKPYVCNVCDKSFACVGTRNLHSRIHTGRNKFKCEICQEEFRLKHKLDTHLGMHFKERDSLGK